jgi:hypothetical protein
MRIYKYLPLFILLVYLGIFFFTSSYHKKTVYGDGIFYYSWLRSIVIDHDFSFNNEYTFFNVGQLMTKNELLGNQFAIGPAIFWFPSYMYIHSLFNGTGYEFVYQVAVGLTSVLFALTGLVFLYMGLTRLFSNTVSCWTTIAIAYGTNILFYGAFDTVNSHALSFFTGAVVFYLVTEQKKKYFLIGLVTGLLGLIRIQDAAMLLIPIGIVLLQSFGSVKNTTVSTIKHCLYIIVGWIAPLSIQFFCWYLLYGDIRIPYIERGYGFNFLHSAFLSVLFSPNNGLFLWTPLVFLSVIGLVFNVIKNKHNIRMYSVIGLLFFLWQTYLIGSWSIWWQGASYSGRMFISLLPIMSVGIAHLVDRFPSKTRILILCCCFLNVLLVGFFLFRQ